MRVPITIFLPFVLLFAACGDTADTSSPSAAPGDTVAEDTLADARAVGTPPDTATMAPVGDLTQDQRLMLIEEVPLGLTYEQVRQRFPTLGALRTGSGPTAHLSDAVLETEILGYDATIEFNFESDRLYSYYYAIDPIDCEAGETEYAELQDFYNGYYGEAHEEEQVESGYSAQSSYWRMGDVQGGVALTLGRQAGTCRLGWGFQEPAPI